MTGATAAPGPSRSGLTFDPRRWALWRQSRPIVAYVLVWEATVLAIATVAVLYEPVPSRLDWTRAMLLALCATVSIQLARRQDERRGSRKTVLFIELTSIWTFPAVL